MSKSETTPTGGPAWSQRRWMFTREGGPEIFHRVRRKGMVLRKSVRSHRLSPIDLTRYPGARLREIRASKVNFLGEARR